jgi:cytoskeleton protein RodZ
MVNNEERGSVLRAFGDQLREAREARGHSLQAVADATRIVVRHLEAIERSDVEALPAGPFARGYIEAYAQFLGIDPQPVLEAYRAVGQRRGLDVPETRDRVYEEFSELMEERAKATGGRLAGAWKGLLAAGLVAGLVGLGWWLSTRRSASEVRPSPVPPREVPSRTGAVSDSTPEKAAAPSSGEGQEALVVEPPPSVKPAPGPASTPTPPAPPEPAETLETVETPETAGPPAELEVSHAGVGTGVERSRLVGRADRFPEGTPVVFWTRVLGGRVGDVVRHVWIHEGQTVGFADLPLGGTHWRTYSRRELPEGATGRWAVEARGPGGEILARQEFLCIAAEGP